MDSMALIFVEKHPLTIKVRSLDNRHVMMDNPIHDNRIEFLLMQLHNLYCLRGQRPIVS